MHQEENRNTPLVFLALPILLDNRKVVTEFGIERGKKKPAHED